MNTTPNDPTERWQCARLEAPLDCYLTMVDTEGRERRLPLTMVLIEINRLGGLPSVPLMHFPERLLTRLPEVVKVA